MSDFPPQPTTSQRTSRSASIKWIVLGGGLLAVIAFLLFAHPFLAVTRRVDADILVVEGWIPDYMLPATAQEFQQGGYRRLLVSGLENDPEDPNANTTPTDAAHTATVLLKLGVPAQALVTCPAPFATWMRTSKTSRAVRQKSDALALNPRGVNVVTAGPHARETWVAYENAFGDSAPVGIISIPKTNYPANRWWLSRQGLIWVPKDFVAWLKEVILGRRA